jgi:hypothetical protein
VQDFRTLESKKIVTVKERRDTGVSIEPPGFRNLRGKMHRAPQVLGPETMYRVYALLRTGSWHFSVVGRRRSQGCAMALANGNVESQEREA